MLELQVRLSDEWRFCILR